MDDLLKLAKQFDINMFQQDEDAADERLSEDRHAEDGLDFLFDGPTQRVSGGLSQASSQAKPSSSSRSSSAATTNTKDTLANDAFEDDWDDDDFLADSLLLEMTQNPQTLAAPTRCSTQKPSSPVRAPVSVSQSAVEKDKVRQRRTFKLESGPRIQTGAWTNGSDTKDAQQSPGVSVKARSQWTRVEPQNPFHQRTSVQSNMAAPAATITSAQKPAQSSSSRHEAPAASDLLDDDLLSVFSSDPVWDDPADDDLLFEVCEDLENQILSAETVSTKQPVGNPRAVLQPANQNRLSCAASPLAGGFVSDVTACVRTSPAAGSVRGSTCVRGSSGVQPAPQGNARKDQFTFKKPSNPVSTATSKGKSSFLLHTLDDLTPERRCSLR